MKCYWDKVFLIFFLFNIIVGQQVSYIRYYKTDSDFMIDVGITPEEARGSKHIEALYNRTDQLILKMTIDEENNTTAQEIFEYNEDRTLSRRAIADGEGKVNRMMIYGDEPMSSNFISLVFPNRNKIDFAERTNIYYYNKNGSIRKYKFLSLDHTPFGEINYDYFDEGLIKLEQWRDLLNGMVVRQFTYNYNPISREYIMVETDAKGNEVSKVGITLPRKLFTSEVNDSNREKVKSEGNTLEESSEIIEDILLKKADGWNPTKTIGYLANPELFSSPDLIYMKTGDTLKVNLFNLTEDHVRFFMLGDQDILTMSLSKIDEIERRDGKVIYPLIYR